MKLKKLVSAIVGAAAVSLAVSAPVFAHGYIETPASRAQWGAKGAQNVGGARYEPQSLETGKGFPAKGPADGKIASAGGKFGGILDEQSSTRWIKNDIKTGVNTFTWKNTAPHRTTKWHYYITKQNWNPDKPLSRDQLELIATFNYEGKKPGTYTSHDVVIPADRSGYHVVLGVWDIADTGGAFYQVVDVNVIGGNTTAAAPEAPTNLKADLDGSKAINLSWTAAQGQAKADEYKVFRSENNGSFKNIGTAKNAFYSDNKVVAGTSYRYYVIAANAAGESKQSNTVSANVPAATAVVFEVTGLHTMSVKAGHVELMWNAAEGQTIRTYEVYRGSSASSMSVIGKTAGTSYTDKTASAEKTYYYKIVAINDKQETSKPSSVIQVTTPKAPVTNPPAANPPATDSPAPAPNPGTSDQTAPEWSAVGAYTKGDIVSYQGNRYEARQSYRGYGDQNWNPTSALSLWKPAK